MARASSGVLQVIIVLMFEWSTGFAGLFECLIPLDYCLGSLLPIGYTMQNAQMSRAVFQLPSACSTLSQAQACTAMYTCNHTASRERINRYTDFFTWLCQQTHVVATSVQCWEYPFENDVISCGELHISGPMGIHLMNPYHPCPFILNMVNCVAEKMHERAECTQDAINLYIDIILKSSVAFAGCRLVA
ncbi:uncharacterized protein LOC112554081 [Pomacea canaliculata]|uniref:uncharacterized protein LOC112554081 n=1 Tax=Pomacea canaliculata TaxID=400727 RepID=UPI000D735EE3|nr:uncharacterized protein LOC112554081 [Pomacea canaliculata]